MAKKWVWDVISILFIILVLGFAYLFFMGAEVLGDSVIDSATLEKERFRGMDLIEIIPIVLAVIYTLLIIILAVKHERRSTGKKVLMILLCLIIPGIFPFIYYFFLGLRKQLGMRTDLGLMPISSSFAQSPAHATTHSPSHSAHH